MEKDILEIASIWDSEAEKIAFNILKGKINEEYYQINKHVSLKEIIKSDQKKPWMEWHIDFLIEDLKGYPVLGIEINGIKHWNDPKSRKKDKEKKSLFVEAEIPLVCIPLPELPSYTKEEYRSEYPKALEALMDKYLLPFQYRTSYPVYCRMCGQQMAYLFRNDYTAAFYSCLNKRCNFKTISDEKIPLMLNTNSTDTKGA